MSGERCEEKFDSWDHGLGILSSAPTETGQDAEHDLVLEAIVEKNSAGDHEVMRHAF
jgi:hypothetical protein